MMGGPNQVEATTCTTKRYYQLAGATVGVRDSAGAEQVVQGTCGGVAHGYDGQSEGITAWW